MNIDAMDAYEYQRYAVVRDAVAEIINRQSNYNYGSRAAKHAADEIMATFIVTRREEDQS